MRDLSDRDLIRIWELGVDRSPADRALEILAAVEPESGRESLAGLAVGRRNWRLLQLRDRLFGRRLPGFAHCPRCREPLELDLDTATLHGGEAPDEGPYACGWEDVRLTVRPPDSLDLAAAARAPDAAAARRILFERCVLQAERGGAVLGAERLPADAVTVVAACLEAHDPLTDIELDLECPACGHGWSLGLDIAAFLWREIAARARRLMQEVDRLARAYGWSEAQILDLHPQRRRFYLELVG
jgi:hypothetical protein